jgi:opacity protein-like surface antigen
MSKLKIAAVAAAILGGALSAAEAQSYGHYGHYGQRQHGWHHQAPPQVYVSPRVARKQAQLQERFVEKYGVQRPQYHRPYHYRPQQYGYGYPVYPQPRQRLQYDYGW